MYNDRTKVRVTKLLHKKTVILYEYWRDKISRYVEINKYNLHIRKFLNWIAAFLELTIENI